MHVFFREKVEKSLDDDLDVVSQAFGLQQENINKKYRKSVFLRHISWETDNELISYIIDQFKPEAFGKGPDRLVFHFDDAWRAQFFLKRAPSDTFLTSRLGTGLVTISILLFWLFTVRENCKLCRHFLDIREKNFFFTFLTFLSEKLQVL